MRRRNFVIGAGLSMVLGGLAKARVRPRAWDALDRFTVVLPRGFSMFPDRRAIDGSSVQIMKGKTAYVAIFLGDYVDFPGGSDPSLVVEDHPSNPRKTATVVTNGRRRISEYLWETLLNGHPTRMVVMAYPLPGAQQAIADQIAASVRPRG